MRLALFVGALGASSLVASVALAQSSDREPSVDLRGYRAPMDAKAGLALESATSPDTGEVTAGLRLNYAFRSIVLRDDLGHRKYSLIEHQLTSDVLLNVGLFRVLTLGIDLPAVIAQGGDDLRSDAAAVAVVGTSTIPHSAIGDPAFVVKATILKPEKPGDNGVALGFLDRLTLPIGDRTSFLAEQSVTDEARLLFDGRFAKMFTARANAGAKLRGHTGSLGCQGVTDGCLTRFGHELSWGAGLTADLKPVVAADVSLIGEVRGYLPLAPVHPFESRLPSGTFAGLAARWGIRDVNLLAGTELALDSGIGNAPFRITLGVSYAPKEHDKDHDGIDDEVDRCPTRPEDRDGVDDEDGCPEGGGDGIQCDAAGEPPPSAPVSSPSAKPPAPAK
jgi:hypothetical protein